MFQLLDIFQSSCDSIGNRIELFVTYFHNRRRVYLFPAVLSLLLPFLSPSLPISTQSILSPQPLHRSHDVSTLKMLAKILELHLEQLHVDALEDVVFDELIWSPFCICLHFLLIIVFLQKTFHHDLFDRAIQRVLYLCLRVVCNWSG